MNEREIFANAAQKPTPAECAAYLDEACGSDLSLRQRIESLLREQADLGSFLESPAIAPALVATVEKQIDERPGTMIGPYKLLEQIGEGGFGVVFMAEQQQPVRRKVALKVLKPGMDTRQVVARFEAERQALALMDHPNIAKVLDAGQTASGRPYFVMDLVKGIPITDYCDQSQLAPRERLELFAHVCQAIQHAHQKGIIHRDIKPSNVLVTLHDGAALVKVIDFGVAKALGQQLTDKTLFTGFAQMIGTPLYMSPEQAALSNVDVDTRSDIYSLGVLLYELLTGTTPFDKERLKSAAFDEIRRIIREDEPPKPSTRLSDLGRSGQPNGKSPVGSPGPTTSLASIAALRKTEPRKLSQLIRGELDWIVMKALEKDRNRRYETASGFALDIQRYLADEPVQACPPSASYRIRKFVRRNRGPVLAAALVLVVLLVGIAGTTTGWLQAIFAGKKERLALIEAEDNLQTAREAVDRMYTRAAEQMRDKPQLEQIRRALLEDALRFYRGFLKKKSNDFAIRYELALAQGRVGEIYGFLGDLNASLENHRAATAALAALAPQFANDVKYRDELARAHFHTANALLWLLRIDEGAASMEEAIVLWEALTNEFPDKPSYLEDLARANIGLGLAWKRIYSRKGDHYIDRAYELTARLRQRFQHHEISAGFKSDLASFNSWRYEWLPHDAATLVQLEHECRDGLATAEAEMAKHPDAPAYHEGVAGALVNLDHILAAMNRSEERGPLGQRILEIRLRLATQYPDSPEFQENLAWTHWHSGFALYEANRPDEALEHFRTAIALAGDLTERFPENLRSVMHLCSMIRECPVAQLRDPKRALVLAQRCKELGDAGWDDVAEAQVDAGLYHEALETCEKASRAGQQTVVISYATAVAYWHLGRQAEARELVRQFVQQVGSQPNRYWYGPEYRRRVRETAKLMELEIDDLKAVDSETSLRSGIALYRKLVDERPDDPGLLKELTGRHTELYRLLSAGNRKEEAQGFAEAETACRSAIAAWEKLASREPGNNDYRSGFWNAVGDLSNLLSNSGHFEEAEQTWKEAIEKWPDQAPCRRNRAEYFIRLGLFKEAAAELARAYALEEPDSSAAFYYHALLRLYVGDVAGYQEACWRMLARFEESTNGYSQHELANVLAFAPDPVVEPSRAIACAERAIADHKTMWRVLYLGLAHYRAGHFERAKAALDEALAMDANWWPQLAHSALALAEQRLGNKERASTELGKAQNARDGRLGARLAESVGQGSAGWWEQLYGEMLYHEAWTLIHGAPPPDDPRPMVLRGRGLQAIGRIDEARAAFAEAFALAPDDLMIRIQALPDINRTDDFARGLAELRAFLKDHPAQPQASRLALARAHVRWGAAQSNAGPLDEAPFDRALEVAPIWEAWSGRAFVRFHRQQWEEAVADFSKAIELAPEVHTNWWHRGHCYLNLAQWDKAAANFGKVVEEWPEGGEGWYWRAVALANLNQPDKALADLRQAIHKGFAGVELMKNDSRLDPLRVREDFGELLREFEQKAKEEGK
jgi:serine/threonine protein kinase/tetratricopeptide (TPR) repeat protein